MLALSAIEGSQFIPDDIPIGLQEIRQWAYDQGLIWDEELQIVSPELIAGLVEYFPDNFPFSIVINIFMELGKLSYFESPFVPIAYLIQTGVEVEINAWKVYPAKWEGDGTVKEWGKVGFAFFFPNIEEQLFSSVSYSKRVATKFFELAQKMPSQYEKIREDDGSIYVDAYADVGATFFKNGRAHDVKLVLADQDLPINNGEN